ncbi:hypothetical protein WEH80_18655 [Actinomycetes bacterium KLBMP 9759]
MNARTPAVVLGAGFLLFWVGAAFWSLDFQQADTGLALHAVAEQSFRWAWIHVFQAIGTVITAAGFVLWHQLRRERGDVLASGVGATSYLIGAALWVTALVLRLTVTVAAAAAPTPGYALFDLLGSGLLVGHLLLAHAASVLFGIGLVRSGDRAVGTVGIVVGGALGIALAFGAGPLGALSAPFLAQLLNPVLAGYLLLTSRTQTRRSPHVAPAGHAG